MNDFEITVKVNLSLNELFEYLKNNNFIFHQSFRCIDIFLIKKEYLNKKISYQDLNKCLIIRELIFKNKTLKYLVIKNKEYDENGNIINSSQENIDIDDLQQTKDEYLSKGYVELIKMDDYCYTYSKDQHEFIIEYIEHLGIFIEFENKNYDSNLINGKNIEELIKLFDTFNIDYDKSNYFIKKAWLLIQKEKSEYIK